MKRFPAILPAFLGAAAVGCITPRAAADTTNAPTEIVLVSAAAVSQQAVAGWKKEGFRGLAIVLDEQAARATVESAARQAAGDGLAFYLWIEVGRNPKLADEHPRWMASLGLHQDWQKRFSGSRLPAKGEVAKAWPWVPIWYREAFEAHLKRIESLLQQAPTNYQGLLLNDLQGGPASCGCGNLQCRWATDYHVPATGQRMDGDDVPARFLAAVRQLTVASSRLVIPVWTTECEDADLPANQRKGKPSTGLCGSVGCSLGLCPKEFGRQWSALWRGTDSPIALLGLHHELERSSDRSGGGPPWLTNVVRYLDALPLPQGRQAWPRERLWMVAQGANENEEWSARRIAAQLGVSVIVIARARVEQSYQPRLIPAQ